MVRFRVDGRVDRRSYGSGDGRVDRIGGNVQVMVGGREWIANSI
jgi:hypothetical protein